MAQGSFFGDWRYWPLLKRLAVVAATKLSGLTPCGALLAALCVASTLLLLLVAGVPARTAYAGTLNFLGCATTIHGRIEMATAGDAIPINTGKHSQSLNRGKGAPDQRFCWPATHASATGLSSYEKDQYLEAYYVMVRARLRTHLL